MRKAPDLVAAFKATLEELSDADLLLHVVDASDENLESKKKAVEKLLEELEIAGIPRLLVLNKVDKLPPGMTTSLLRSHGGVAISAAKRQGLRELIAEAEDILMASEPFMKDYSQPETQTEPEELVN